MAEISPGFSHWAIVELMGHVRIAGHVTEVELFGSKLGKVDIPNGDGFTTQYFNGSSLYRLTPTTEEIARAIARDNQPAPVYLWKVKQLSAAPNDDDDDDDGSHIGATGYEFSRDEDGGDGDEMDCRDYPL